MSVASFDLHRALAERGAILDGHFRLSSGRHSNQFVQKFRILEDPEMLEPVGRTLADRFRSLKPTVVAGAAVGAILLAYEVARQLGVKAIFVEKENGTPTLRRGFTLSPRDRVLVVEDVVTTGLSVTETIDVVRRHGAAIVGLGVIVARDRVTPSGVEGPTHVLLELPLTSYDQAECPQCRAGEALTDPGSRRS